MAANSIPASPTAPTGAIPVRTITDDDLRFSLRQGWEDFRDLRGDLIFAGLIYTLIRLAAVVMTTSRPLMPFFLPVVAGVALLGPVAAVGFYELARRREHGDEVHWFNFLDVRKRPSLDDMGIVAGLLLLIFLGWLLAAGALYALIFGWFVLALSVASLPMLVDCDVTAAQAVSASWRASHRNKSEMVRWGIVVSALLVLGSIPLFVGLALVLPWLGYSTWHLYTRLIDREAVAGGRCD